MQNKKSAFGILLVETEEYWTIDQQMDKIIKIIFKISF